jgi:TusA-related sulfurtransferase
MRFVEEYFDLIELDITNELCPMTFVHTRLALDRLSPGEMLRVRLRGDEPRRNVPRSASDLGHEIVSLTDEPDGTTVVVIRRA